MAKAAARQTDLNACPLTGHATNPAVSGSPDVFINGLPALRVGDTTACGDTVTEDNPTILINGRPLAFLGSATAHGGVILTGSGDVLIGTEVSGAPFVPPAPLRQYSERYQFIDPASGAPVAGVLYCLEAADGQREIGYTDEQGNTGRLFTFDPASVHVRWDRDAADYLRTQGLAF